jgi:hypothetical protein
MRPTLRKQAKRVASLVTPFGEDAISTSDASQDGLDGYTEISASGNRATFVIGSLSGLGLEAQQAAYLGRSCVCAPAFCSACGSTEDPQRHHLVTRGLKGGQACQSSAFSCQCRVLLRNSYVYFGVIRRIAAEG